jgi:DNA-binding NarL/FixJ family response regulator
MQSHPPISVFLVDDSDSIRARLVTMLAAVPGIRIAGEARNAADAIAGILASRPDSVLLDLNLGASSGMEVLRSIRKQLPVVRFVVLTNHSEPQYRHACTRAGAEHCLDKSTQFDCVRHVIAGLAGSQP